MAKAYQVGAYLRHEIMNGVCPSESPSEELNNTIVEAADPSGL
jgi:hypothetical protein